MATLIGSTSSTATIAAANPRKRTTGGRPSCPEQPDEKAGQTEESGRHADLDEDVVAVGQDPASQHMLEEGKRRGRVHRSPELTGADAQQGVMQHVVRALPTTLGAGRRKVVSLVPDVTREPRPEPPLR